MIENHSQSTTISTILPIIADNKSTILLQAVYFFKEADFQPSENLQLLIQVSDEYYGFTAFNAVNKKVLAWVFYQAKNNTALTELDLLEIKTEQNWLNDSYKQTTIVVCGANNTLFPKVLSTAENNLLNLMYAKKVTDVFLKDQIIAADAVNEYSVANTLYQLVQTHFTNTVWYHIQSLLLQKTPPVEPCIMVTISFHSIFINAAQNSKWILLQNKTYQTPEDVLYHLLNCIKQLGFDEEKTTILIDGMVEENSALTSFLYQYLHIMEWNTNLQFSYPPEASSISKHTLAPIDRLLTCV